jgi:hypothetical protein
VKTVFCLKKNFILRGAEYVDRQKVLWEMEQVYERDFPDWPKKEKWIIIK